MAGTKPINKPIRGIRDSVPGGYVVGRTGSGKGPPILLPLTGFASKGYVAGTTIMIGGAAGGDLSGTYPNPTVAKINGNAVKSGVPSNNQVLTYITADTEWEPETPHYVIAGGTTGQVLEKNSNTDYDLKWATAASGGAASIQDSGTAVVIAMSDANGQLILDGSGDPIFVPEVFPAGAIPALPYDAIGSAAAVKVTAPGSLNRITNGDFRINQGTLYVSAATLVAGTYGHDMWSAGASGGDYSFTQLKSSTVITIAAAKSLLNKVEDVDIEGGQYTLSWTGTSTARIGINGAAPTGAFAVSPITTSAATAGQQITVEFSSGTLSNVMLNPGTIALAFENVSYAEALNKCMRYFQIAGGANGGVGVTPGGRFGLGQCISTTQVLIEVFLAPPMRVAPTVGFIGSQTVDFQCINATGTAVTCTSIAADSAQTPRSSELLANVAMGLIAGNMSLVFSNTGNGAITFSSRL